MKKILSKVQPIIRSKSTKMALDGFFKKYQKVLDATDWDLVEKYMRDFRYGP